MFHSKVFLAEIVWSQLLFSSLEQYPRRIELASNYRLNKSSIVFGSVCFAFAITMEIFSITFESHSVATSYLKVSPIKFIGWPSSVSQWIVGSPYELLAWQSSLTGPPCSTIASWGSIVNDSPPAPVTETKFKRLFRSFHLPFLFLFSSKYHFMRGRKIYRKKPHVLLFYFIIFYNNKIQIKYIKKKAEK